MALIKTIAEVKDIHPRLVSSTSKDSWIPNFDAAEYKYLVPLTGTTLYNTILTKYEANSLTTIETTLLRKMQALVVAAAYLDEAPRNTAKITDNGIRSANSAEMQRIYGWEYKEFKQGLTDLYYDSMEVLLNWLYDNKSSFSDWTGSTAYTSFSSLLIKNGTDFNDQYRMHQPMRTYWMLRGVVVDVQDNYHRITLGDDLLEYFVGLASTSNDLEKLIIRALKKAMAFLTVYRTCRQYSVRFSDAGFTVTGGDTDAQSSTQSQAATSLFEHHMRSAEEDGLQQLERAKRLCKELRTEASVTAFNTAYDAGPLVNYATADISTRNDALTSGFRLGI